MYINYNHLQSSHPRYNFFNFLPFQLTWPTAADFHLHQFNRN